MVAARSTVRCLRRMRHVHVRCALLLTEVLAVGNGVCACSKPERAAQIVVIIDADFTVSAVTDSLQITISGGAAADFSDLHQTGQYTVGPPISWPYTEALAPRNGDTSRRFAIDVLALDSHGDTVVRARAQSGYVAGKVLGLPIDLEAACRNVVCGGAQTCRAGTCESASIDPVSLEPYPHSEDGGTTDGGTTDGGTTDGDTTDSDTTDGDTTDGGTTDSDTTDGGTTDGETTDGEACDAGTPSHVIARWSGEGSAVDSVGGHDGTTTGGVAYAPAFVGQGFSFDGIDDGVAVPYSPDFHQTTAISVSFRARSTEGQISPYLVLVEKSHGSDLTGWFFNVEDISTGILQWGFGNGVDWSNRVYSNATILDGEFHHIVGTYDGAALRLFVDGQLADEFATTDAISENERGINIGFFWGGGTPGRFFHGILDEVTVFDVALDAAQILAEYRCSSGG